MEHKIRLSKKERINIWLELSDFSFRLMKNALSKNKLNQRLKKMREEHLRKDYRILTYLTKIK